MSVEDITCILKVHIQDGGISSARPNENLSIVGLPLTICMCWTDEGFRNCSLYFCSVIADFRVV